MFCTAYLDDIIIFSSGSLEDHEEKVRLVLQKLRTHRLFINLEKSEFSVIETLYLGFVISRAGLAMEASRVQSIKDWPAPKTHKDVQIFLGFANFYRRFIQGFARIAGGLTALLKGGQRGKFTTPFHLTPEGEESFETLKEAFMKAPLLRHFDPTRKIRIESDASGYAVSAILSQLDPETG